MLAANLVILLALVDPAICQGFSTSGYTSDGLDFQPDHLTAGILAIYCLFTVFYVVLMTWCLVTLMRARRHRTPYGFLCLALIFSTLAYAASIALERYYNIPAFSSVKTLQWLSYNWADWLLYCSIIAMMRNRQSAIYSATVETASPDYRVAMLFLAILLFVLGTTGPGVYHMYFNSDTDYAVTVGVRLGVYSFGWFLIVNGCVAIAFTVHVWRASRVVGVRDKITNAMLDVIAPLYATYCLLKFIFLIVFSPHGLPSTASQITYEGAVLANNLLLSSCYCAIVFSLLFLSVNQQNWNVRGGTTQPSIFLRIHKCTAQDLAQLRESMHDEQPHNIIDVKARESMLRQQLADLEKAEQRSDVGPAGLS